MMLLALLAAAAALRPQLSGVGPLLDQLGRDLGISHSAAGLLTTIPVACMGLLAFVSAGLTVNRESRRVMTSCLACIAIAGMVRAIAPGGISLIAATIFFGVGAGVAGTLLPAIVKASFPARATQVTALYSIALNGAAALSATIATPLARIAGGWRGTFAVFGVWDLVLTVAWAVIARDGKLTVLPETSRRVRSSSSAHAGNQRPGIGPWVLALVFGLQATVFYGLNAWLAEFYSEHGWAAADAGALVGVLNFSTLPATLGVAALSGRLRGRARYLVGAASLLAVATLGIVLVPAGGFVWPILAGVALGTIFPLCMAAPVDLGSNPQEVTRATGVMLGGGYLIAALSPFALGALRDSSGSFTDGMWMLFAVAGALLAVSGSGAWHARRATRGILSDHDATADSTR